MIILDTDVLSALMRSAPDEQVVVWLNAQPRMSVWITSVTVFEIQFGLQMLPAGKRHSFLSRAFEMVLRDKIEARVVAFDESAAQASAKLMAARQKRGRPAELRDTMIAGIAIACRGTIATRDVAHFSDLSVPVVNPWNF